MKRLVMPAVLFGCGVSALVGVHQGYLPIKHAELAARLLIWLGCIAFGTRTLLMVLRANFERRSGHTPPRLLLDVVSASIWIAALSIMSVVELGISPSAAFATSGVLLAVIGFAVRSLVADLFYGITMAIERPFEIGNWIGLNDGIVGRVEEMTWRAVKVVTKDNVRVVVPNTQLAVEHIVNYDQPEPYWRSHFTLTLGYEVPAEQVKRLLQAAVHQVPASANVAQQPEARITGFNERGVEWEMRYWLPDYPSFSDINQSIQEAFLQHLRFAGLRVPRPREEIFLADLSEQNAQETVTNKNWIDRVELFSVLKPDARLQLQDQAQTHYCPAGSEIVRQGEVGASLFIIREGTARVFVANENAGDEMVGTMGPGDVFGEMSLLTGAPRSATIRATSEVITHEITHQALEPILTAAPELARSLAEMVAIRKLADRDRDARSTNELIDERLNLVDNLLNRARQFFKLGRGPHAEELVNKT